MAGFFQNLLSSISNAVEGVEGEANPQADLAMSSAPSKTVTDGGTAPYQGPQVGAQTQGPQIAAPTSVDADTSQINTDLANGALTQVSKGGIGSLAPLQRQALARLPVSQIVKAMKLPTSPTPPIITGQEPPARQTVTPGEGRNVGGILTTPGGQMFNNMKGGISPTQFKGSYGGATAAPTSVIQSATAPAAAMAETNASVGNPGSSTADAGLNAANINAQTARDEAVNTVINAVKSPGMTGPKLAEIIGGVLDAFGTAFYGKAGIQHTPLLTQKYQTQLQGKLAQMQAQAEINKQLAVLPVQTQNAIRLATAQGDINRAMQIGVTAGVQPYVMQQIMAKLMMEAGGTQMYYNPKQAGRQAFSSGLAAPGGGG